MFGQAIIINVDDNEPSRYVKHRVLSRAGLTVYDATGGNDALRLVSIHNPDLILLDVNLPDLNGIEVCRRVKSTPEGASIIVLQISALATAAPQATAALDNGADAYLVEPVDPDVLVATIKALLRLRKAERGLAAVNERLNLLNAELQRSNEDLAQFALMASHDLQEPLRTISSFASLLERRAAAKLSAVELEYLTHIADGSRRMRSLIDDLLSYSRVGQKPSPSQAVHLDAVLHWALENLGEVIVTSGADIVAEPLPSVMGDESQLGLVFQNLIGNAIKYACPGIKPVIRISAVKHGRNWEVRVMDNGLGIESKFHQLIFSPFKRLHGREIPGTGIGLAVCRRIIEAHGGEIWVDSALGRGATFCFSLPDATKYPSECLQGHA